MKTKNKLVKSNLKPKKVPIKLARDPEKLIIIPDNEEDMLPPKETILKYAKNQHREPISIPEPSKSPEISPINEPVKPEVYPEENPVILPNLDPDLKPPYTLPHPPEIPQQ